MSDHDESYDHSAINDRYEFDFGRVGQLLAIVQMQASTAPTLTNIGAEAMAELREINEELKEIQKERSEAELRAAQDRANEEAARKAEEAKELDNPPPAVREGVAPTAPPDPVANPPIKAPPGQPTKVAIPSKPADDPTNGDRR